MHITDVHDWEKLSWENKRIYLQGVFTRGEIKQATRRELEDYLIVLANATPAPFSKELDRELMDRQAVVISHLLQVRLGQEQHWRSFWLSIAALAVSVVSIILTVLMTYHHHAP